MRCILQKRMGKRKWIYLHWVKNKWLIKLEFIGFWFRILMKNKNKIVLIVIMLIVIVIKLIIMLIWIIEIVIEIH